MAFGVTPTGFEKKTFAIIKAEMEASERTDIDPSLNLAATSVFGQMNGIYADKLRELWDVAEGVYRSLNPDFAEGDAQDQLCSLDGVRRLPATFSTVSATCTGTPGTLLLAGRIASVGVNGDRFVSLADAVIGGGGTVAVDFQAEVEGPVQAPSGTLITIVTPVAGWASVTNVLDALPGTLLESDSEMRVRRISALTVSGDTTDSVLAAVKAVSGVTAALIFENISMITDDSGVPAKSFETVIEGGSDPDLVQAIYSKKPAGIQAYGNYTLNVADSQGVNHLIGYSRPTEIDIWIVLTVSVNVGQFGSGDSSAGILAVQEAITAYGDALTIGQNVVSEKVKAAAVDTIGVVDILAFTIGIAPAPVSGANISVSNRGLAVFDTSRIAVTVVAA